MRVEIKEYVTAGMDGITEKVEAIPLNIANFNCFMFYDKGRQEWNVSHLETGMKICCGDRMKFVVEESERRLTKNPEAVEKGKEFLIKNKHTFPINEI